MKRIRRWWAQLDTTSHQIFWILVVAAMVFAVPTAILSGDWTGFFLNLGTELAGGAVTFVLIDQVVGGSRRKADLIARMGSKVNEEAKRAAEELERHGWLEDGSLQGVILSGSNLQGAILIGANLRAAEFWSANLQEADMASAKMQQAKFWRANLQGANLSSADMQRAEFHHADLRRADLRYAGLQEADLSHAKLQGADITQADLRGAILNDTEFDENTTLPDGELWAPDTNVCRFTNPDHPNFFQSQRNLVIMIEIDEDSVDEAMDKLIETENAEINGDSCLPEGAYAYWIPDDDMNDNRH